LSTDFDLALVGAGFSGSLLAAIARRLGLSVILIEKAKHPRFAIGESSTPLANILLEELADRYELPRLRALSKWGTWQDQLPQVAGGLKRGFTFYHHEFGKPFAADPERQNQLLVAASPNDRIGDTHWYRANVDQLFTEEAIAAGAEYSDQTRLSKMTASEAGVRLEGTRLGAPFAVTSKFVFDATGPRGFIHHAAGLFNRGLPDFPNTQGLFSHFYDVGRVESVPEYGLSGIGDPLATAGGTDFLPGSRPPVPGPAASPPYPVDDAAVHHVFDGGWMWVLRFNNGLTSAGIAVTDERAGKLRLANNEKAWRAFLDQTPSVRDQFANARLERPLIYSRRLSYLASAVSGPGWAMLPSAAGFVDPLLSTGFPLTLLGIQRLASLLENDWGTVRFAAGIEAYAAQTERELLAAGRLVAALYRNMNDFPRFTALSLLYFAAASFSETVRRLGKPELAGSFLLENNEKFGPAARELVNCDALPIAELRDRILEVIQPFDLAGLTRTDRRNWYPVDFQDLRDAKDKIGATAAEIEALILRCEAA
jgi:FADH2 O2-dependent halogenase